MIIKGFEQSTETEEEEEEEEEEECNYANSLAPSIHFD